MHNIVDVIIGAERLCVFLPAPPPLLSLPFIYPLLRLGVLEERFSGTGPINDFCFIHVKNQRIMWTIISSLSSSARIASEGRSVPRWCARSIAFLQRFAEWSVIVVFSYLVDSPAAGPAGRTFPLSTAG